MANVTNNTTSPPAIYAAQQGFGYWRWVGSVTQDDYIVCPFSPSAIEIGPTSEVDSAVVYYTDNTQRSLIMSNDRPVTYPLPCRQGQIDESAPNIILQPFSQAVTRTLFLDSNVLSSARFDVIFYLPPNTPSFFCQKRSPYIQQGTRLTDGTLFTFAGFGRKNINLVIYNRSGVASLTSWSFYGYKFTSDTTNVKYLINTPAAIAANGEASYVLCGAQFDAYSVEVSGVPAAGVGYSIDMRDS